MIAISGGGLIGPETAKASLVKVGVDAGAFADTFQKATSDAGVVVAGGAKGDRVDANAGRKTVGKVRQTGSTGRVKGGSLSGGAVKARRSDEASATKTSVSAGVIGQAVGKSGVTPGEKANEPVDGDNAALQTGSEEVSEWVDGTFPNTAVTTISASDGLSLEKEDETTSQQTVAFATAGDVKSFGVAHPVSPDRPERQVQDEANHLAARKSGSTAERQVPSSSMQVLSQVPQTGTLAPVSVSGLATVTHAPPGELANAIAIAPMVPAPASSSVTRTAAPEPETSVNGGASMADAGSRGLEVAGRSPEKSIAAQGSLSAASGLEQGDKAAYLSAPRAMVGEADPFAGRTPEATWKSSALIAPSEGGTVGKQGGLQAVQAAVATGIDVAEPATVGLAEAAPLPLAGAKSGTSAVATVVNGITSLHAVQQAPVVATASPKIAPFELGEDIGVEGASPKAMKRPLKEGTVAPASNQGGPAAVETMPVGAAARTSKATVTDAATINPMDSVANIFPSTSVAPLPVLAPVVQAAAVTASPTGFSSAATMPSFAAHAAAGDESRYSVQATNGKSDLGSKSGPEVFTQSVSMRSSDDAAPGNGTAFHPVGISDAMAGQRLSNESGIEGVVPVQADGASLVRAQPLVGKATMQASATDFATSSVAEEVVSAESGLAEGSRLPQTAKTAGGKENDGTQRSNVRRSLGVGPKVAIASDTSSAPLSNVVTSVANATRPGSAEHRTTVLETSVAAAMPVSLDGAAALQVNALQAVAAGAVPVAAAHASTQETSAGFIGSGEAAVALHGTTGADSLVSPLAHTTLEATPTVLEVGVPGGTHGWLKIRAEIGEGGAVQASMSATTHAGQETLRRELPAINAFLDSEHVGVSVQMAHTASAVSGAASLTDAFGPGKDGSFNLGSGLSQNADGQAARDEATRGMMAGEQQAGEGGSGGRQQQTMLASEAAGRAAQPVAAARDTEWTATSGYGGAPANGGGWLNVMA